MSAEELRAEIETTKARVQAAVARKKELQEATAKPSSGKGCAES